MHRRHQPHARPGCWREVAASTASVAQLQPCCLLRSELAAACLARSPQSHIPGRRKGLTSWVLSQPDHARHPGTCGCSLLATAQPRGPKGEGC